MHTLVPIAPSIQLTVAPATEIYPLSLHDALPILCNNTKTILKAASFTPGTVYTYTAAMTSPPDNGTINGYADGTGDRKSTRLNSSHTVISYAVFCLKKKNRPSAMSRLSYNRSRST